MKKFLSLLVCTTLISFGLKAEFVFKKGYVVTNAGDTIRGEVKVNTKKELNLFQKVSLKISETENKLFNPSKIKEYGFEEQRFVTRKNTDGELCFMKVLTAGEVTLFEHQFEYYHGSEIMVDSDYYIEKSGEVGSEPKRVKGGKLRKFMGDLVGDDSEFVKTKIEDKKYEAPQMIEIVQEYNEWATNEKNG